MPGKTSRTAALALLLALLAACAAYRYQHASRPADAANAAPAAAPAAAPSAGFRDLPEGEQLARVRGEVEEVKANLTRAGKYACCVRPACNECLLKRGECNCRHEVDKGGPCCGECTEAWLEGRGAVEGIDAWELLERKKKSAGGGGEHRHR